MQHQLCAEAARREALIGGVEKRDILLRDHDPSWADAFDRHRKRLADALGDAALRIEHIGSTAVPGLAAKPIVDMLLVVADSSREASYLPQIERAGYILRVREPQFDEHRMFRTPDLDVHIHVFSPGCSEIERYLIFRDRLRTSTADRLRYEQAKRTLAARSWLDMNAYADAKTEIVESILAAARSAGEKL